MRENWYLCNVKSPSHGHGMFLNSLINFFSFQNKGLECYSLDYLYAFYVFFYCKTHLSNASNSWDIEIQFLLIYWSIQLKRTSLFKILSAFLLVLILTWRKRKEMREEGSYNFCDRDCARYFTLTISLNLCNIIIHFIDVETAAQKGLFTCQWLHLQHSGAFHSKFTESMLTWLRLHSALSTLVLCLLL